MMIGQPSRNRANHKTFVRRLIRELRLIGIDTAEGVEAARREWPDFAHLYQTNACDAVHGLFGFEFKSGGSARHGGKAVKTSDAKARLAIQQVLKEAPGLIPVAVYRVKRSGREIEVAMDNYYGGMLARTVGGACSQWGSGFALADDWFPVRMALSDFKQCWVNYAGEELEP